MSVAALVFPHQLFQASPALAPPPDSDGAASEAWLIEDSLFFGDERYPARFHKQKLAYHRATMAAWASAREAEGVRVHRHRYAGPENALPAVLQQIADAGHDAVRVVDVHDFTLQRRLAAAADAAGVSIRTLATPAFINDPLDNREWREGRNRWHMADFYAWQRRRLDILMDGDEPRGGKFSFDEDNRRKLPKKERAHLPSLPPVHRCEHVEAAIDSVEHDFPDNPGSLRHWYYPIERESAQAWLAQFLEERFERFGPYEDAIVVGESWLYHAVLTPMLNIGLLTPDEIVDAALATARRSDVPLNSVEGFVRQIIGWREFMRATYDDLGVAMRTTNHWSHTRPMPNAFYDGTTGIVPIDDTIQRVLDTGYCHHIERLMVLGGFMFLCEIDPDDIYTWFMEMFIDAYDWVMVPNVYAMSQHADGGAITTKPYFSGSNYVLKMSDHVKGDWSVTWDALFWRWVIKQSDALAGNPRWSMMVANARRMPEDKRAAHQAEAERFLSKLR